MSPIAASDEFVSAERESWTKASPANTRDSATILPPGKIDLCLCRSQIATMSKVQSAEKTDLDCENSKNESGRYNGHIVTHPSIHNNGNTEYFTRGLKNLDWSRGRRVASRLAQPRTRRRSRFTAQVLFIHGEKGSRQGSRANRAQGIIQLQNASTCASRGWNFLQATRTWRHAKVPNGNLFRVVWTIFRMQGRPLHTAYMQSTERVKPVRTIVTATLRDRAQLMSVRFNDLTLSFHELCGCLVRPSIVAMSQASHRQAVG